MPAPEGQALRLSAWTAAASALPRPMAALAVAGVVGLGIAWRLRRLHAVATLPLGPDVSGVYSQALAMRHLYDTGIREPLWPWLARLAVWLDPSPASLRWLSLMASVALIALGYRFGRDYTGRPLVGLGVAAVLAYHRPLIQICADGHRTELLGLTLLAVTYCALVPGLRPGWRLAGLAVTGAAAPLTSLALVIPVGPLLAWAAWRHRLGWRGVAVPVAVTALLVTPHLVHNARTFGHPLSSMMVHSTFYRNYEFVVVRGTGCATCPSRAEVAETGVAGAKAGLWEYFIGLHSLGEIAERTWAGYAQVFWRRGGLGGYYWHGLYDGPPKWPWDSIYYAGLAWLLLGPYRMVALVPLLGLNGLAFLIPLGGIDPRLVMHLAPYAAFAATLPVAAILEWALRAASPRRERDHRTAGSARRQGCGRLSP